MTKMLHKGYQITRADGTKDRYYGWTIEDIRRLEISRFNNVNPFRATRLYSVENEPYIYLFTTTDEGKKKLIVHDPEMDEFTELEGFEAIADYIWTRIFSEEGSEENEAALKAMGVDIFDSFGLFRVYAFKSRVSGFVSEAEYLDEVEHSIAEMGGDHEQI